MAINCFLLCKSTKTFENDNDKDDNTRCRFGFDNGIFFNIERHEKHERFLIAIVWDCISVGLRKVAKWTKFCENCFGASLKTLSWLILTSEYTKFFVAALKDGWLDCEKGRKKRWLFMAQILMQK